MRVFSGSQNIAELLKMVMTSRSRCDATNVATSDNAGVLSLAFNKYSQAVVKETYTGVRRLTPETGFGVKVRSGYAPIKIKLFLQNFLSLGLELPGANTQVAFAMHIGTESVPPT